MPQLRRNAAPALLRTVRGKPHAIQNDHHDTLPTPPASNSTRSSSSGMKADVDLTEDINADPLSSDEEERTSFRMPAQPAPSAKAAPSSFRYTQLDVPQNDKQSASFRLPIPGSPQSIGSKRSAASENGSSESEGPIFSSQGSTKRQRTGFTNIHAKPSSQKTYSKRNATSNDTKRKDRAFNQARKRDVKPEKKAARATFKAAKGADMFEFTGRHGHDASFQAARSPEAVLCQAGSPGSSVLSSAPSDDPDVEEIEAMGLSIPTPAVSGTHCAICGDEVDGLVREDFQDEFKKGTQLNYKWQQRFCLYHKQHRARKVWQDRDFPTIDWQHFGERLRKRKHRDHLKRIISGQAESHYRQKLEQDLKCRSKTALQTLKEDDKRRTSVGYYGPRGEKLMTDFILADFAKALRDRATKDDLFAASGVHGGVSGFVQAVLVPELAVSLMTEDMGSGSDWSPVELIAESAELGELLHPDVEDKVHVVEEIDLDD